GRVGAVRRRTRAVIRDAPKVRGAGPVIGVVAMGPHHDPPYAAAIVKAVSRDGDGNGSRESGLRTLVVDAVAGIADQKPITAEILSHAEIDETRSRAQINTVSILVELRRANFQTAAAVHGNACDLVVRDGASRDHDHVLRTSLRDR